MQEINGAVSYNDVHDWWPKIMQSLKRFQLPIAIIRHLTPNHSPALHPPKLNVFAQISWVVQGKAGVQTSWPAPRLHRGTLKLLLWAAYLSYSVF